MKTVIKWHDGTCSGAFPHAPEAREEHATIADAKERARAITQATKASVYGEHGREFGRGTFVVFWSKNEGGVVIDD